MTRPPPALAWTLLAGCALLVGCRLLEKKKPPSDDDDSTTNAPTVQVAGTGAKNEKDVLRYKNEVPAFDEPAVIGKDGVHAKTFPGTGADVALLPRGTAVVKKAKFFSTGILVLFDDPSTANGTKLMGWITPEALIAGPAAPNAPANTGPRAPATAPKDAGLAAIDAGLAAVDAGKPAVVVDAGGGGTAPAALLQVLPTAGKCPAGFAIVGPFCRRPCVADSNCPVNSFCTIGTGSRKTCSATR